jgi:hypothetical protein
MLEEFGNGVSKVSYFNEVGYFLEARFDIIMIGTGYAMVASLQRLLE